MVIVFVNTLLQQLLLAAESDLLLGFSLRTAGEKLSACKILLTQFFPIDSRQVAQEYIAMFFASNNKSEDTMEHLEHMVWGHNEGKGDHSKFIECTCSFPPLPHVKLLLGVTETIKD